MKVMQTKQKRNHELDISSSVAKFDANEYKDIISCVWLEK